MPPVNIQSHQADDDTTELIRALGVVIREMRKQRGWTLEVLAGYSGVTLGYLAQIEVGKNQPSLIVVGRIAFSLGVTIRQLFTSAEIQISHGVKKHEREPQQAQGPQGPEGAD
jgi:transcriptional regulator with XRE-family HTH domain